jgi:hypothetical protein
MKAATIAVAVFLATVTETKAKAESTGCARRWR